MSYDPYEEDSRFLSAPSSSPRKSTLSRNRSNASLRGGTSSLAHELAAALLPEPTTGSRLLAEEFGIEYDEGAEGIDGLPPEDVKDVPTFAVSGDLDPSMVPDCVTSDSTTPAATEDDDEEDNDEEIPDAAAHNHTHTHTLPPPRTRRGQRQQPPEQAQAQQQAEGDAMALLSQNLESTEKFIAHLRRLDMDGSAPLALETLAVDIISRLNETARDREEQVRELLKYEREFQRIAGEVGGSDALASLDALEDPRGLLADGSSSSSSAPPASTSTSASASSSAHESTRTTRHLDPVTEEEPSFTHDWEVDPDTHLQPDGDPDGPSADIDLDLDLDGMGGSSNATSPIKDDSFATLPTSLPPLPINSESAATPAGAIPHLAHLRTHTASLVSSLSSLSEHAQVNGAATTEAGRKLRALKNKLGGWRTDLDSAERSRLRIERWEADVDVEGPRRVDGRDVVAEHLREFERVLFEANAKAQAIMAPA